MTITTRRVRGIIVLPDGTAPRNGRVTYQLSGWDREGVEAVITGPITVQLDSDAVFDDYLWCTDTGQNGRVYLGVVAWHDGTARRELSIMFDVQSGVGTQQFVPSWVVGDLPESTQADALAQCLAAAAGASADAVEAAGSAAAAAASAAAAGVNTPRADMDLAIAGGFVPVNNVIYTLDDWRYIGATGATALPGLPGLLPLHPVTPFHFGAIGNGVADDRPALNAALAYGEIIIVPPGFTFACNGAVTVQNGASIKCEPPLSSALALTSGSKILDMQTAVNSYVTGLRLIGTGASGVDPFIDAADAVRCSITECEFVDAPGSAHSVIDIKTGHGNKIKRNLFIGNKKSGVSIRQAAYGNEVTHNVFKDGADGFGVRVEGYNNDISFNYCDGNEKELIGIFRSAYGNRVIGNHAEHCGDNGISVSGSYNTVIGNQCRYNDKAGIWVWGSFNVITGNQCVGNNQIVLSTPDAVWAGIGVSANYGGCGQYNTITANTCDDDQGIKTQQNGIRLAGSSYDEWQASTSYTKSSQGTYVVAGLRIYLMVTNGTATSGTAAPTHTSGEVSDGGIVWRYVNSFVGVKGSVNNTVGQNTLLRSVSAPILDVVGGTANTILDRNSVGLQSEGNVRIGILSGKAFFFGVDGEDKLRFSAASVRPVDSGGMSLGETSHRFSTLYAQTLSIGPDGGMIIWRTGTGSPEGAVSAAAGSFYIDRAAGPATTVIWVKKSGTGNTGWVSLI